ncbi:MAG: ABC transporter permease [Gomphosphaeria aponina SAG 52.96 = DSM 107014]|uniref:ABC transporter permease n=1 Tax=Gomphosphaeria aponina SAG 52.96 = DSM 107014 TaxID=1521640 RepID=A0A941GW50_9CHRO|nr:ABC transporter permease [Gomphosphaeria aponina SAG 52.96 = DSM 107014]
MVSIARKNLLEDIPRFLVAQAGIMFAATLVTIQTGILNGFSRSTVLLIENSQADIWVSAAKMEHFEETEPLLMAQVEQATQVKGVKQAEPLILGLGKWQTKMGKLNSVRLVGFAIEGELFQPGNIVKGERTVLKKPYTVMADESRLTELMIKNIGDTAAVTSLPVTLGAIAQNSQSIVAPPFLFSSLENVNTYLNSGFTVELNCTMEEGGENLNCTKVYLKTPEKLATPPIKPLSLTDPITHILIKAEPGQDLTTLKQRLAAALPGTVANTTAEMAAKTSTYWKDRTGLGIILGLGAAVGIIVGMVVVSQILYASVSDHLKEFGTLKAMGASDLMIYGVVIEQSLWMAVMGYLPAMLICLGVSSWAATKGIIILITPGTGVGVFGIVVTMSIASGLLAIQKVTHVDPAIVFKA